jgi:hypothetical protein
MGVPIDLLALVVLGAQTLDHGVCEHHLGHFASLPGVAKALPEGANLGIPAVTAVYGQVQAA